MKMLSTTIIGGVGLLYGLVAVLLVYRDVPMDLQAFIVAGVATVGVSVGWLIGTATEFFRKRHMKNTSVAT